MQTLEEFEAKMRNAVDSKPYIEPKPSRLQRGKNAVKAVYRLKNSDFSIQFYYNQITGTTNFALLKRQGKVFDGVYGRNGIKGEWHMHPYPGTEHDHSAEGRKKVTVEEFLKEIDEVLRGL